MAATIEAYSLNLTKLASVTLGAMVTIDVHARDELVTNKIQTPDDFDWLSQLR